MSRENTVEITSSDKAALCMLFVEGRIVAAARGGASAPVRPGQHVRWFVRPRRRNAQFSVVERRRDVELAVAAGICDRILEEGEHFCPRGRLRAASITRLEIPQVGRIAARPAAAARKAELATAHGAE